MVYYYGYAVVFVSLYHKLAEILIYYRLNPYLKKIGRAHV